MRALRRPVSAGLAVAIVVLTLAFALRWVDVATREVAALQAVGPVTGAGIVVVTLVALVLRFWRLLFAGVVVSVGAGVIAVTALHPASASVTPGTHPVTVLSSNMEFGGADAGQLVAAVRERHADVAVFVELTPVAGSRLKAAGLETELPYAVGRPEVGTTGAMIWSRWPLTLLDEGRGTGGSLFWEPYADVRSPAGGFRVKAIHTRQPIVSASGWRQDLKVIGDWQRSQPTTEPLVLAGDFNASQAHPAFRLMADGVVDAHRAAGLGWVRTWPQGRRVPPFVQLDHVLERGFDVLDAGVVGVAGTDHAAVWARLALP
ncbi:MAG: endonuclease/exonuclease/phosphatase family protein [Lapillicoccus sp.]